MIGKINTHLSVSLRDEEEGKCKCNETECSEEDICSPSYGLKHIRRYKADDTKYFDQSPFSIKHLKLGERSAYKLHIQVAEVVMEIAFERIERLKNSEGNTHPIGAMRFSCQSSYHSFLFGQIKTGGFAERIREIDVIDIYEGNTSPPSSFVVDKIGAIGTDNASNDNQRNAGSRGSTHEKNTSTQFIDEEKCGQGTETVDDAVNARGKKGALREGGYELSRTTCFLELKERTVLPLSPSWRKIVGA